MNLHPLNVLDGLVIITLGWNFLRGFNKGFVEEVVSLLGLFLSAAIAFFGAPFLVKQVFPSATTSQVVSVGVAVYLISFFLFKYLALSLNKKLSK
ncbi:MAG: hypothetical protein DSY35_00745, partial [Desulfurobacterium sp.]